MKTSQIRTSLRERQRQGGVAVIVMLALLSIILIYITANIRSLTVLERELKLTEQRQIHRLDTLKIANLTLQLASPKVAPTNAPVPTPIP
jgi:hypothetical protein